LNGVHLPTISPMRLWIRTPSPAITPGPANKIFQLCQMHKVVPQARAWGKFGLTVIGCSAAGCSRETNCAEGPVTLRTKPWRELSLSQTTTATVNNHPLTQTNFPANLWRSQTSDLATNISPLNARVNKSSSRPIHHLPEKDRILRASRRTPPCLGRLPADTRIESYC
jgi:hypothetical protein